MMIYQVQLSSGKRTIAAEDHEELVRLLGLPKEHIKIQIPTKFKNYGFGKILYTKIGYENMYGVTVFKVKQSRLEALIEPLDKMTLKINDMRYPQRYRKAMEDRLKGETCLHSLMNTIGDGYDAYPENS